MNGLGFDLFCDFFKRVHYGKMTRGDSVNLKLPKVRVFKKSIKFQGPHLFNKFSVELKKRRHY